MNTLDKVDMIPNYIFIYFNYDQKKFPKKILFIKL
jgi:hypothetical protein